MKKFTIVSVLFIIALGFSHSQNTNLVKDSIAMHYANSITVKDLKEDLTILASDALEGRETGERGQKMAAAYIKAHFEELGLVGPVKKGDPYFQDVPLKHSTPGDIYMKIGNTRFKNIEDFFYRGSAYNTEEISTKVVFAGGGTEAEFEGLDLKGKSIFIQTSNRRIRQAAMDKVVENGGKMLFVVFADDQSGYDAYNNRFRNYFRRKSIGIDIGEGVEKPEMFIISPSVAAEMFNTSFDKIKKIIVDAQNGNVGALKSVKPVSINYKIEFSSERFISENVLGYLEGSEFKDEVIVITAHYDHEGIKNGEIYNGADDDGSGTVALMDIAEAFVKAKEEGYGPRRSILFMTVTGEEKGLLGSEYYTDNPIFPLENTVVDLNIDMVGRIGTVFEDKGEYVRLVGSDALSTELHNINEMANEMYTNLYLDYTYNDPSHPERIYYRSDHWNFAKNGIPIIFYGNGGHADYHKPTDTVDKILFELLQKRTKLIFHTAWIVANKDERIVIDKKMDPNARR